MNEMTKATRRSAIALVPGAALYAFYRIAFAVYDDAGCGGSLSRQTPCINHGVDLTRVAGIGWICMMLWLPVLCAGIAVGGLSMQSSLRRAGMAVTSFYAHDALAPTWKGMATLIIAATLPAATLLFLAYPWRPESVHTWSLLFLGGPVLTLIAGFRQRRADCGVIASCAVVESKQEESR